MLAFPLGCASGLRSGDGDGDGSGGDSGEPSGGKTSTGGQGSSEEGSGGKGREGSGGRADEGSGGTGGSESCAEAGTCPACVKDDDCMSQLCDDGRCSIEKHVPCRDITPRHATTMEADVLVMFHEEDGWGLPSACDFVCEHGYARVEDLCLNRMEVPCKDVAPINASSKLEQVEIVYSPSAGWSATETCEYQCDEDFELRQGACIDRLTVPCTEEGAPAYSSYVPEDVTVRYTSAGGWADAALCDWTCNPTHCPAEDSCLEESTAPLALEFALGEASKWFGGDEQQGSAARNVGVGQSFKPPARLKMSRFAFYLTGGFQSDVTGTPATGPVQLKLQLRDAAGEILLEANTTVAPSFTGGWVYWDMSATLQANVTYIFTANAPGAFVSGLWTGVSGDAFARDTFGQGYDAEIRSSNESLDDWSSWEGHSWDFWYRLEGTEKCYFQ